MKNVLVMVSLLLAAGSVSAQEAGPEGAVSVPGLNPPAASVQTYTQPTTAPGAQAVLASAPNTQVQGDPAGGFGPAPGTPVLPQMPRPRESAKAPPAEMTVRPGVNVRFGVALSHVNRIVTPFASAKVVTTSQASITTQGPIVYVSTNMVEPIGLFVHDASDPTVAVSLTLIPGEMQPVSTAMRLEGHSGSGPRLVSRNEDLAREFESGAPYVAAITGLMRDLAHGRVPDGFGLEAFGPGHGGLMPSCTMPGIRLSPGQLVSGAELLAIVVKATNVGPTTAEINEDACGEQARAMAAWPTRVLSPGQSTELYVVVGRPDAEDRSNQRPTLVEVR